MYIGKQYNILIFRDITKENVHAPYFMRFLYRFIFVTIKSNMTDCMNNLIKHYTAGHLVPADFQLFII